MLGNSGRIGEARPIMQEYRSQAIRSFSRQSQVFPDCCFYRLGLESRSLGIQMTNVRRGCTIILKLERPYIVFWVSRKRILKQSHSEIKFFEFFYHIHDEFKNKSCL